MLLNKNKGSSDLAGPTADDLGRHATESSQGDDLHSDPAILKVSPGASPALGPKGAGKGQARSQKGGKGVLQAHKAGPLRAGAVSVATSNEPQAAPGAGILDVTGNQAPSQRPT